MTGAAIISRSALDYPVRLAQSPSAPPHLYVRGRLPEANQVIALVGARAARGHSMALARSIAAELASSGVVVASGGAVGVDSAAHRGALEGGGVTMAVLAGGLDRLYPGRNRPLFGEILERGGALVTRHPPGAPPLRGTFIARNQVLAGLSDAVLVVEAQVGSGSLTTAEAALRLGRVVAAAPGSPGCEMLLARGAALVENAADLDLALRGAPRSPVVALPEAGSREALALAALDRVAPLNDQAIAERAGLASREAARALAGLELEGLALLLPGQTYLRSPLADQLLMQG